MTGRAGVQSGPRWAWSARTGEPVCSSPLRLSAPGHTEAVLRGGGGWLSEDEGNPVLGGKSHTDQSPDLADTGEPPPFLQPDPGPLGAPPASCRPPSSAQPEPLCLRDTQLGQSICGFGLGGKGLAPSEGKGKQPGLLCACSQHCEGVSFPVLLFLSFPFHLRTPLPRQRAVPSLRTATTLQPSP